MGTGNRIIEMQETDDYAEFLQKLVDCDDIQDEQAEGITKFVIANGRGALSKKQEFIFTKNVVEKFPQPKCERCGERIPWIEAHHFMHEEKYCGGCQHDWNKMEQQ
jgi:hypothetical protein